MVGQRGVFITTGNSRKVLRFDRDRAVYSILTLWKVVQEWARRIRDGFAEFVISVNSVNKFERMK